MTKYIFKIPAETASLKILFATGGLVSPHISVIGYKEGELDFGINDKVK